MNYGYRLLHIALNSVHLISQATSERQRVPSPNHRTCLGRRFSRAEWGYHGWKSDNKSGTAIHIIKRLLTCVFTTDTNLSGNISSNTDIFYVLRNRPTIREVTEDWNEMTNILGLLEEGAGTAPWSKCQLELIKHLPILQAK